MPEIRVITGANGSGKTTFTDLLSKGESVLFNFNRAEEKALQKYPEISHQLNELLKEQLNRSIIHSIVTRANITIVSNYNNSQVNMVNQAVEKVKSENYTSKLIHLHLNSIEESMIRVKYREAEGGREVIASTIEKNFTEGRENVRININKFDAAHIIDNSTDKRYPKIVVDIEKSKILHSALDQVNEVNVLKIIDKLERGNGIKLKR